MLDGYVAKSDEEIIALVHNGDSGAQDYMIHKYKNLVKVKARVYFLKGSDKEDIVQEGMIGLYKAIRDYQPNKLASFYSFAELCITRQIISAVKAATRQKHIPLNTYLSLNKPIYEDEGEKVFIELMSSESVSNPEEMLIGQEAKNFIEASMTEALSKLECCVLSLYLQDNSYTQIAKLIDKDEKAIDNALQRVRRKVEKILATTNT